MQILIFDTSGAAYLIQIGNRDSYGVLNLNRLIIRNPNGGTGIELGLFDEGGQNRSYIIKIGEYAGTGALSKIRVSNICDKDGRNCKQVSELSTGSQITIGGYPDYLCTKQSDDTLKCSTNPASLIPGNGTITIKQGTNTWSFNLNDSASQTLTLATGGNGGSGYTLPAATSTTLGGIKIGYYQNGKNYPVKLDSNSNAYVTVPREAGSGGSGDSLWKTGTINMGSRTSSVLTPKDTSNGLYLKENVYYDSSLEFWGLNNNGSNRTRQLKLDPAGIRIGESTSTYGYTGVGIGVLGAIGIGTFSDCSSNHLTMFASGNTANGNFEILGNSRLLVGTNNDSYIYFNLGKQIGVNTIAANSSSTLTVNGGVKVGNCNSYGTGCDQLNAGEIRYVEPAGASKGYFIGCVKDTSVSNGYRRRILDSTNMSNTNFSNDSSCDDGVPYNLINYTSLGLPRPGQCVY